MDNMLNNPNEVNHLSTAAIISGGILTVDVKYRLLPLNNFETMYGRSIATNVSKDEDDL
jgi:hypothetical protein